jgi:xanthine dehydrogenase accessory factor
MTTDVLDRNTSLGQRFGSAYRDNVIPDLASWSRDGERCALITLVGVDGNAPRAEGAQMAVCESGRWAGYISGGCLEQAIALEALDAIKAGKPRLLRYGKGSPFFDIRLPCGSGLDVFIQPVENGQLIDEMSARLERRQAFALRIDLSAGTGRLEVFGDEPPADLRSRKEGNTFLRVYAPSVRCLIAGSSPIAVALSELAACAGFEAVFYAPNLEVLPALPPAVKLYALLPRGRLKADRWTAAVLAFHDHDQELPVFSELLEGPCFFIAAIGSKNAHTARKLALAEAGYTEGAIARIKSPAGLVAGLKTAPFVALSILAQIVESARDQGIVS